MFNSPLLFNSAVRIIKFLIFWYLKFAVFDARVSRFVRDFWIMQTWPLDHKLLLEGLNPSFSRYKLIRYKTFRFGGRKDFNGLFSKILENFTRLAKEKMKVGKIFWMQNLFLEIFAEKAVTVKVETVTVSRRELIRPFLS